MIAALSILVALGVGLGVWQEIAAQRRIGKMAENFKRGRGV